MSLQLFGVLNYTPDSFYDSGKNFDVETALLAAQQLLDDGAVYVDVGAEATNPFVKPISAEEEIKRLEPLLPALFEKFPEFISLDTYHPETLEWALQFGKPILNDVSGLHEEKMRDLVIAHNLTCVVGHLPPEAGGVPVQTHNYKLDNFGLVVEQMLERAKTLEEAGITRNNLLLDPNIGFGKSMRLNWQLLEFAKYVPDYKVMIGHSNKRFLGCDPKTGEPLENGQELRYTDERNLEAAQIALGAGTAFLRVHDPSIYRELR